MFNNKLFSLLCCPICKKNLKQTKRKFFCVKCNREYPILKNIPDFSDFSDDKDINLSQKKWDEIYMNEAKTNFIESIDDAEKKYFKSSRQQIEKYCRLNKNKIYLEIGSGLFYFGRALGKLGYPVVGIDLSYKSLKLAEKALIAAKVKNYLLVRGNILKMPFKENSFYLIVGFGVIEHFKNTLSSLSEIFRVLAPKGLAYNTVPYLNLGTLTYRQLWGNIPRLPILEDLFYYFHNKILKAKYMRFGYELSFTQSYLKNIHHKLGFKFVSTGQYLCPLVFEFIKFKPLKRLAIYLAEHSPLFWPMIYCAAKK